MNTDIKTLIAVAAGCLLTLVSFSLLPEGWGRVPLSAVSIVAGTGVYLLAKTLIDSLWK